MIGYFILFSFAFAIAMLANLITTKICIIALRNPDNPIPPQVNLYPIIATVLTFCFTFTLYFAPAIVSTFNILF
jgi:hypothetical protein